MPPPGPSPRRHTSPADTTAAVEAYLAALEHPFKPELLQLRKLVLSIHPSVAEGIKWNAPSFRTTEYFATTHLRSKTGLGLILHLGAKARALPAGGLVIKDPGTLLKWLGKDRAMVEFASAADLKAKTPALRAILKQWITYV